MNEEINRLRWACRRGMLELDLLLGQFFESSYLKLDIKQQSLFKELLTIEDPTLFAWLMGHQEADEKYKEIIDAINTAKGV